MCLQKRNVKISITEEKYCYENAIDIYNHKRLHLSSNELGFINRFIYTNIWLTNFIVKINPKDGKVVGKLDLTPYADDAKTIYPQALDIDGIAHDSVGQKFLITGKLWPEIYELNIDLIEELPTIVNPQ